MLQLNYILIAKNNYFSLSLNASIYYSIKRHYLNYFMNLYILFDSYTNGFLFNAIDFLTLLAILSGIFVIVSRNPIVSVLYLIGLFLNISIYLILIGLNFLGLSYLLVYIGAVSILFLFILMLIDVRVSELHNETNNSLYLSIIIGLIFFINIGNVIPFTINTGSKIFDTFYNLIDYEYKNLSYVISKSWDGSIGETFDIINVGNVLYSNLSI
jgi:NADH-ubiquinone oxidoreductase chain 6